MCYTFYRLESSKIRLKLALFKDFGLYRMLLQSTVRVTRLGWEGGVALETGKTQSQEKAQKRGAYLKSGSIMRMDMADRCRVGPAETVVQHDRHVHQVG